MFLKNDSTCIYNRKKQSISKNYIALYTCNLYTIFCLSENGPKMVKIFQNVPRALDFDQAESNEAVQILE